jgi:hypothetical protein
VSASGLNLRDRRVVRHIVAQGCARLLANPAEVHYTQGPDRWDGIAHHKTLGHQVLPFYGDCSSTATWLLWLGLHVQFGLGDNVNGANWTAGYTGTMLSHGRDVTHRPLNCGDLAIYGHGAPGEHVAVCLGGGMVFSHGSEGGPYKLPLRYRPDLLAIRRYI